jgi:diguanylate cyclase (GGDEF)-like protein
VGYEDVNLFHQLRNAAFRDWLTKLPNRNEFINMLDTPSCLGKCDDKVVALVDINHFSDINDGLGQETGNKLLKAVADRLQGAFAEKVKKGRIAADVFGLLGSSKQVNEQNLNELFQTSFEAGEHTLPVNVTIGFCRLGDETGAGTLNLKRANIALNNAKKSITANFEYYAPEMEEKTTWRLGMIRQLRHDFAERKLELWYQPQVDLISEKIVGMEALLRWPTGNGEYISPAVFVPLAEYSGLIVDIGAWVLEESCGKLQQLCELGYSDLRVAVNISIPQFRDTHFVKLVKDTILKHNL